MRVRDGVLVRREFEREGPGSGDVEIVGVKVAWSFVDESAISYFVQYHSQYSIYKDRHA